MSKVEWIPPDSLLTIEREMGDHRWSGQCHQSQQIHVSSAFSLLRVFCQQFMSQKNVFMTRYLHKQVKNIASINTSWYLQCIHFCIGPAQKPQRKVRASYFYCQHILYCPSRCQAGKWEEAKMLWNSIFADLFCSGVDFAVIARVWCHSGGNSEKQRKNPDLSPFYFVSKMNVAATQSPVMAHKSGQFWWNYKTTRRNFGDSVRIYDSPPPRKCYPVAEFSWTDAELGLSSISDKYHPRQQTANVASLSPPR